MLTHAHACMSSNGALLGRHQQTITVTVTIIIRGAGGGRGATSFHVSRMSSSASSGCRNSCDAAAPAPVTRGSFNIENGHRVTSYHSKHPCGGALIMHGGLKQSTFCMARRKTMITMGSPYFVWINTNEIISPWYLLGAVCVACPSPSAGECQICDDWTAITTWHRGEIGAAQTRLSWSICDTL
jgi:hypothetical protein